MEMRADLLKSIWYAFTSLDMEDSGKVSKSQLKVLSHNLYSVLRIPHDQAALEQHFSDDDDGPVSSQGYMPYLNKFILDKVVEGTFDKEEVDELCWTLCSKKFYHPSTNHTAVLTNKDAGRLWCLFNFLSEDKYPLVLVAEEVEYLLKKISGLMTVELNSVDLEEFWTQEGVQREGVNVWSFLELVNSGVLGRGLGTERVSSATEQMYREIVGNVLKEGYLWKKGHLRRNWTERWFCLKPSTLCYYTSEDRKECKGSIELDQNCCVEILPEKEGKRCMFCVKTLNKTYEMSAPDSKQRQEWTTAIQTAIRLRTEGKSSLHKELKAYRQEAREEREKRRALREQETQRLQALQGEKEQKQLELELLKEAQRQSQSSLEQEEQRRRKQHEELQRALQQQLQDAEEARVSMQEEMALKEAEAEHQRRRIRELEELQQRLEEALQQEIKARQDEEAYRYAQARLLAEEEEKTKALLLLQEEQEELLQQTQREKQELCRKMEKKAHSLEEAQAQLEKVRASRHRVDQDIAAAQRKQRQASTSVKHWNVQMTRLMHPIGPGDRRASAPVRRMTSLGEDMRQGDSQNGEGNINSFSGTDRVERKSGANIDAKPRMLQKAYSEPV
ncbi:differentially expressed in FDCP 6 homolog isoform X2 [Electrophorus electricus]|uniref:differentially expressed in FDCP 6 homolog isoform X2 n=1 Tax=Electrophorus electricus TaxID=8005 RepID=UPI0015CFC455|nr:differentially expressed in FDCP 6 homolog isoform X2 [Electrophorus electricus]